MTKLRVEPRLGKLQWAEGTYPTPRGPLFVRHEKRPDGSVGTTIRAPEGIEIEGPAGAAIESVAAVAIPRSSGERYGGLTPPADGLLPQGLLCEWLTDPSGIDAFRLLIDPSSSRQDVHSPKWRETARVSVSLSSPAAYEAIKSSG
jgi:hypothetical protein